MLRSSFALTTSVVLVALVALSTAAPPSDHLEARQSADNIVYVTNKDAYW